jgi:hypothetical protein
MTALTPLSPHYKQQVTTAQSKDEQSKKNLLLDSLTLEDEDIIVLQNVANHSPQQQNVTSQKT